MHRSPSISTGIARNAAPRSGKLLVLFAVLIPSILAVAGLVLDGGLLTAASRKAQHAADAAASAAAAEIAYGEASPASVAERYIKVLNQLPNAAVTTHVPPTAGEYAGDEDHVEVIVTVPVQTHLMRFGGTDSVRVRAVAGRQVTTAPAALVILDPDPPELNLLGLPISLPSVMPLLGGLEVLGLGAVRVDGAIHVNNSWGGFDENGDRIGRRGLRRACSCTVSIRPVSVSLPKRREATENVAGRISARPEGSTPSSMIMPSSSRREARRSTAPVIHGPGGAAPERGGWPTPTALAGSSPL